MIIDDGKVNEGGEVGLNFYLNEDNKALQTELNFTKLPVAAVKKQFEIGIVLVGMALFYDDKQRGAEKAKEGNGEKGEDDEVFRHASQFTRAVAPIVIPMIQSLGDLAEEELDLGAVGKSRVTIRRASAARRSTVAGNRPARRRVVAQA